MDMVSNGAQTGDCVAQDLQECVYFLPGIESPEAYADQASRALRVVAHRQQHP